MQKIDVEICMGTTCFVMGASSLQSLDGMVRSKYKDTVNVTVKTCLGLCQDNKYNKAPYVKVGDEVVQAATVEKVLEEIERQRNE